jgi:hypothetical protein
MRQVAQSEYELLLIANAIVAEVAYDTVEPLLHKTRAVKPQIGRTAMGLVKQTLGLGCVRELSRRGGWRPSSHLDGERVVRGRLWQRHAPPALHFSPLSFELCRWLLHEPLGQSKRAPLAGATPTIADELLLYLACDLLAHGALLPVLAEQPAVRASPLCWLGFVDQLHEATPPSAAQMAAWLDGGGALLLEALGPDLSRRVLAMERLHEHVVVPDSLIAVGRAQDALYGALLDALDQRRRRDLARFVLDAAAPILRGRDPQVIAARSCSSLDPKARLSLRTEARHAAGALFRAVARIGRFHEEHRLIRHFDDGYDVAQHLLREWEPFQLLYAVADGALRELAALDSSISREEPE